MIGSKLQIKKTYIAIILTAIVLLALLIIMDRVFRIQNIVATSLTSSDSKKISSITGLTSLYEKNILFVKTEQLKNGIMSSNPRIQSVSVRKKYPHTLLITIGFHNSVAYLQVNGGYFLLATDGKILEKSKTKNIASVPSIKYYQQLDYYGFQSGDIVSYKDIVTTLRLLIKALDLGFIINNIDINGLSMIVLNSNDKRFMFTTEKDISEQEYQFSAIVKKFRTEKKEFKSLDLRFDKPVISL